MSIGVCVTWDTKTALLEADAYRLGEEYIDV
jgi:hypothetical protein